MPDRVDDPGSPKSPETTVAVQEAVAVVSAHLAMTSGAMSVEQGVEATQRIFVDAQHPDELVSALATIAVSGIMMAAEPLEVAPEELLQHIALNIAARQE
jgi:hypothetical protein